MKKLYMEIGARIRALRKSRDMTQKELAACLGISVKHASSVERGVSMLPLHRLLQLSELLDCSMDYLLRGRTAPGVDSFLPAAILSVMASEDQRAKEVLTHYLLMYEVLRASNGTS